MKYYRPESIEALRDLVDGLKESDFTILAGGTDLMPRFESGQDLPDHLIDIKNLSELNQIRITEASVHLGALSTIQNIHDHELITSEFLALHQASHDFAGAQIRHRGTLGGNICNASPAGDLLPALYAFEAQVTLLSSSGSRELAIQDFILGPGRTALEQGEILAEVVLPRKGYHSHFEKVGLRQSMAISVVNAAFVYQKKENAYTQLKIAAGSVAPTIVTLDKFVLAYLKTPQDLLTDLILIDEDIRPIDDIRATASYRSRVLKNLVQYYLQDD